MSSIYGEGYYLLIAAIGKIPDDIKLYQMSALDMKLASHRVIPFEFLGEEAYSPAMCIAPEWWATFDKIVGSKKGAADEYRIENVRHVASAAMTERNEGNDAPIQLLRFGPPYGDPTKLDAFKDMLIDRIDEISKEEIGKELREAGIDMTPAIEKLRLMIDKKTVG